MDDDLDAYFETGRQILEVLKRRKSMAGKINIINSTVGIIKDNICSGGVYINGVKVSDEKHQGPFSTESPYRIELNDPLRNLPKALINENGGAFGFVCIWRSPKDGSDESRKCTVGEFLSKQENQSGSWFIDGGWGGPPGPIRVAGTLCFAV